MVIKKKTPTKRRNSTTKRYRGTNTKLTGHHAEKCEVCGAQAKHLYEMGEFELLFCKKHYGLWLQGFSIAQMREREGIGRGRKTTTRKRVEAPIMKCGHKANAVDQFNNPVCAICFPSKDAVTIDKNPKTYDGTRLAKCSYCNNIKPSSYKLPFFNPQPDKKYDDYYCGCRGWD